ncbi:MAG: Hpt domain-containing protein [Lachnospiraceae bacterium]|nr:Hpt domain-containing protein [Lachnospiraceae bacterium]
MAGINKELLVSVGIDVDEAMHRLLNNEELLIRFLKKFPTDGNYKLLKESLEKGDVQVAFRAAHTIKGLCGNLSMNVLKLIVSEQVEYLRAGNLEEAIRVMPRVTAEYEALVEVISTIS